MIVLVAASDTTAVPPAKVVLFCYRMSLLPHSFQNVINCSRSLLVGLPGSTAGRCGGESYGNEDEARPQPTTQPPLGSND